MLKAEVKISHVKDLGDARYAAGMGVEMIGFPLSLHEGKGLSLKAFEDIRQWVSGVRWIAEIPYPTEKEPTKEMFKQLLRQYAVDMAEVTSEKTLMQIPDEVAVIFRYRVQDAKALTNLKNSKNIDVSPNMNLSTHLDLLEKLSLSRKIDYYLLEGSHEVFIAHSKALQAFAERHPVLLDTDILPDDLDKALALGIQGFAVNSRPEERPGWKEYAHLADLLERLQAED